MTTTVQIGGSREFELKGAILIYGEFATVHDILKDARDGMMLGPARALTSHEMQRLTAGIVPGIKVDLLPTNVLVRTENLLVWWTRPTIETMYWRAEGAPLNGKRFPQPPLIWAATRSGLLWVRALLHAVRPSLETDLMVAPYWNTDGQSGSVCLGSARKPEECVDLAAMPIWRASFFESQFTHVTGSVSTRFFGELVRMWETLAGAKVFPSRYLAPAKETLSEFLQRLSAERETT